MGSKYDYTVGVKPKPLRTLVRKEQIALTKKMKKAGVPAPKQFKYGKNKKRNHNNTLPQG